MDTQKRSESERIQLLQDGKFYYGYVIVVVGFALMLLAYVVLASATSVFVRPVTEALGINRSTFLVYKSIHSIASILAAPFLGRMAARGQVKKVLLLSSAAAAIGFIGFATAHNIWQIYVFSVLTGIGFIGTCTMPISVLVTSWFGGRIRGTMMGLTFIGSGLGGMAMLPFLTYLISNYGWRAAYFGSAAIFVVVLIPAVALFIVKSPEEKGFYRMGQTSEEAAVTKEVLGMTYREAKKTPMYWLALLSVICTTVASGAILNNSVPYYRDMGIEPMLAASLAGLQLGLLTLGKITVGPACDRFGIKFGTTASMYLFGLTFAFLYMMQYNAAFVYAVIICYGVGGGTITLSPSLMINGIFGEKDYGRLVADMTMAVSIGALIAAPTSALVFDMTGTYGGYWMFSTIVVMVGATCRWYAFILHEKRQSACDSGSTVRKEPDLNGEQRKRIIQEEKQ
ncbi:MAG: MFS transporter [Desulfovibrio sp.]|nr:MFS transporter [Desulfovibrio sp.]